MRSSEMRIIQYLGSKVKIIPELKEAFEDFLEPDELIVDLFAGTGVVGNSLKNKYRIIANDVQEYSYLMNKVLLDNNVAEATKNYSIDKLYESKAYKKNYLALESKFSKALCEEERIILENDFEALSKLTESEIFYNNTNFDKNIDGKNFEYAKKFYDTSIDLFSEKTLDEYKSNNSKFPYSLFTIYYLNSYFGLKQCIEIDSLKYAIDNISENEYQNDDLKQVLIACLLHAISETVSSVGKQFAQPIKTINKDGKIKDFAIKRCMNDRKKDIRKCMTNMYLKLSSITLSSVGKNKVFNLDYKDLLSVLENEQIGAFYIDPPYTIDHYSRFYHIPETLIKYDYPDLEMKKYKGSHVLMRGRYRVNRFQSNFCIPSKGNAEFRNMISKISTLNSKILLSYSDHDDEKDTRKRVISRIELLSILNEFYDDVKVLNLEHNYRKLNKGNNNKKIKSDSEMLIMCS